MMYEVGYYRVKKQRFFCFYRLRIYEKVKIRNNNNDWIDTEYDLVYSEISIKEQDVVINNSGRGFIIKKYDKEGNYI